MDEKMKNEIKEKGDEYVNALKQAYDSMMKLYTLQMGGCSDLLAYKRMAARIGGVIMAHDPLWGINKKK